MKHWIAVTPLLFLLFWKWVTPVEPLSFDAVFLDEYLGGGVYIASVLAGVSALAASTIDIWVNRSARRWLALAVGNSAIGFLFVALVTVLAWCNRALSNLFPEDLGLFVAAVYLAYVVIYFRLEMFRLVGVSPKRPILAACAPVVVPAAGALVFLMYVFLLGSAWRH